MVFISLIIAMILYLKSLFLYCVLRRRADFYKLKILYDKSLRFCDNNYLLLII